MPNPLLPVFAYASHDEAEIVLGGPNGLGARIFVAEHDIIRLTLVPAQGLRQPKTWAIAPGAEDVPTEGRDRFDRTGFSRPGFALEQREGALVVATAQLRLTLDLTGLRSRWESRREGEWRLVAEDRPTQAYNFGEWGEGVYHYLKRDPGEMYFGLGERAGEANRAGQRYRMCNIDAMGYDARRTDPLYKHIPFYIVWQRQTKASLGIFYDTLADCVFDMGREIDAYHGPYRYFAAEAGDLDYWMIAGETPADIARRLTWLTGRPAFMPKWSLGYSGSTMTYTDAPNAAERMGEFLAQCEEHDILCESFHLSSGYTTIGDNRYVFHWNRDKFPDPRAFADRYLARGVRLVANIKPAMLHDHPGFTEAAREGLFVKGPDGAPHLLQFWGSVGAYLDFTNPKTLAWWKARVTEALLDCGVAATWNDNNEFEIWSPDARAECFGRPAQAKAQRVLSTLLMMRASREAQKAHAPLARPFLVSRAGVAGMQRYAQTWSGDNSTAWETLQYNVRMGTGLAMSGVSNLGHDIGGFAGPAPDAELLLRWVQFGIFLPRFSIHSWNDDGTVNEPWMYPESTAAIADLIKFRARLTPYLYDLAWRSHSRYEPMIRPTYYDFPGDDRTFDENDDMMLGANLLVAPVVQQDARERAVTLPAGAHWYDYWSGESFAGGQEVRVPAPWDRPPLLVRAGSAIALNLAAQHFGRSASAPGFDIFPPQGAGAFAMTCFEDDGESEAYRSGEFGEWTLDLTATAREISVELGWRGAAPRPADVVTLRLPLQETRRLSVRGGKASASAVCGLRRVTTVRL